MSDWSDTAPETWLGARYENGSLTATEHWTAILTVVIETPHDAEHLHKNPLGVFVNRSMTL